MIFSLNEFHKTQVRSEILHSRYNELFVSDKLLQAYVQECNRTGYESFATFYEHNLEAVLMELEYLERSVFFIAPKSSE